MDEEQNEPLLCVAEADVRNIRIYYDLCINVQLHFLCD